MDLYTMLKMYYICRLITVFFLLQNAHRTRQKCQNSGYTNLIHIIFDHNLSILFTNQYLLHIINYSIDKLLLDYQNQFRLNCINILFVTCS